MPYSVRHEPDTGKSPPTLNRLPEAACGWRTPRSTAKNERAHWQIGGISANLRCCA